MKLVASSARNMKLTTAEDIELAERLLAPATALIGAAHRHAASTCTASPPAIMSGCAASRSPTRIASRAIPTPMSALHALTDAILGAIGDGDIGQHFPPSDPQWRGAASRIFLADAAARVRRLGGRIVNVDVTLLCEAPKIGPHREAMREAIGGILGIDAERVGIKATTTEGLGFTGRGEGIAAMASATVLLPGLKFRRPATSCVGHLTPATESRHQGLRWLYDHEPRGPL